LNDIVNRKLLIYFVVGTNEDGNDVVRTRTINNVRTNASLEQMDYFASKYGSLSAHNHIDSVVADYYSLRNATTLNQVH